MTEVQAFREMMRMIERNLQARRDSAARGAKPRSARRLLTLIVAAECMVEISGCRDAGDAEGAIFLACKAEVKRLGEISKMLKE